MSGKDQTVHKSFSLLSSCLYSANKQASQRKLSEKEKAVPKCYCSKGHMPPSRHIHTLNCINDQPCRKFCKFFPVLIHMKALRKEAIDKEAEVPL